MGTDRDLVERAQRGDPDAFESLMVAIGDHLLAIAFRVMRDLDLAEEAVQLSIVAAWRELPRLRDPDRFEAWMRRVVVNRCNVLYRDARRFQVITPTMRELPADRDVLAGLIDRDTLERAFRHLPVEQRVVLVYRFYRGLSLEAIATELEIPLGTAKSRLHYALDALRAAVAADERGAIIHEAEA